MNSRKARKPRGCGVFAEACCGPFGTAIAVAVWIGLFAVRASDLLAAHSSGAAFRSLCAEAFAPLLIGVIAVWLLGRNQGGLNEDPGIAHAVEREGDRIGSLFSPPSKNAATLMDDARLVSGAWDRARDQALRQSEALRAALRAISENSAQVTAELEVALGRQARQIEMIDAASRATTAAIASRVYALDAAVDGALARSEAVLGNIADEGRRLVENSALGVRDMSAQAAEVLRAAGQVIESAQGLDSPDRPIREEAIQAANRFIDAFESLLAVPAPGASDALTRLLLSSDVGRLYLRLSARTRRLSARA